MRVLLIEDDASYRLAIEAVLKPLPFIAAVLTAGDGEQGLALLERSPVEVVVLDLGLPGLGGLDTCRRIKTRRLPVLVLTSQEDPAWVERLWQAGADGYLHKGGAIEQLPLALRSLQLGASWWDRNATEALRPRPEPEALADLTPRERDVLEAMASGRTNQQIADSLGIGAGTVRIHVHTILQKLQVSNRTQAVLKLLNRAG
jgi:two-component system NarL family response regulator